MKRTAFVTGGSKGIGAAVVKKLCEDGFRVAVNYNSSEQRATALCSELSSQGYEVIAIKGDVASSEDVRRMFAQIRESFGRVSVLVNNAGISLWGLFDTVSDEQWQKLLGVNLTGAVNCSREALKDMLYLKNGRIINISSVWGQVGASCEAAYSATKAGLIGLTKALAKEYAPSGITVNCVSPGVVETDMMNRFSDSEKAAIYEEIPMGRPGLPEEIAAAVAFFACDASSYITGQILGVNGGTV